MLTSQNVPTECNNDLDSYYIQFDIDHDYCLLLLPIHQIPLQIGTRKNLKINSQEFSLEI